MPSTRRGIKASTPRRAPSDRRPLATGRSRRRCGSPTYDLRPTTYHPPRGFTLVEVLVVIGILVVLFNLLMVPMMMGLRLTSSSRSAVQSQDMARGALEQMRKDAGGAMLAYVYPAVNPAVYTSGWKGEFISARLDLVMPKTDNTGRPIHPLTPDSTVIRYYIAPLRVNVGTAQGWPKYWNPLLLPNVGVVPASPDVPHLYVLYRVRFDLARLNDPTYMLQGCDPWRIDFYDDPNPSPVPFGPQVASYSFWWRRLSTALTPLESTDAALYAWQQALGVQPELRSVETALPTGEVVAAPGFGAIPVRKDGEDLVANDRGEPTTYSGSLPLWAEWPPPIVTLSNGNPPAGQEFWTIDLRNGSLNFALSRTEYFDGGGPGTPTGDGPVVQDPDAVGAYNVYQVSMSGIAGLDRGGPTDALGNPIADFVIIPYSEKVQVIDDSGNISDYTREAETDPTLIQSNGYHMDCESGRITFSQGFNDPAAGATNDIIVQFQYRRNVLREQDAVTGLLKKVPGSDDSVLATYSSLAQIDVRLVLATYSHGRNPVDEFRVSSRLEVGNAPR